MMYIQSVVAACLVVVPGRERAGGGDQVEDSDHGHFTEISSRTCTHRYKQNYTHICYSQKDEWI